MLNVTAADLRSPLLVISVIMYACMCVCMYICSIASSVHGSSTRFCVYYTTLSSLQCNDQKLQQQIHHWNTKSTQRSAYSQNVCSNCCLYAYAPTYLLCADDFTSTGMLHETPINTCKMFAHLLCCYFEIWVQISLLLCVYASMLIHTYAHIHTLPVYCMPHELLVAIGKTWFCLSVIKIPALACEFRRN